MSYVQPIQSSAEFKAVDLDVEENVRTLTDAGAVFRQGDNSNTDATTSSLSALLRRVSGNSTREIDTLIGDLRDLREKLRSDGERIHRDKREKTAGRSGHGRLSRAIRLYLLGRRVVARCTEVPKRAAGAME
jgi:hypothetical protein